MWKAVLEGDWAFDGRFVYAVRTTGIYCRPSCPSRQLRRDNVGFFPSKVPPARPAIAPAHVANPMNRGAKHR